MKVTRASHPEIIVIEPDVHRDDRGFFMETYHRGRYGKAGLEREFVQDNYVHSRSGAVRGLHYQLIHPQGKLVYAVRGAIFDVIVDIRKGSPLFAKWFGFRLTDENHRQVYVPPGFAHGYCVLSEFADVVYKCTSQYAPDDEYGILWSDPDIGIHWPVDAPLLSEKDRGLPRLSRLPISSLPAYGDSSSRG